MILVTGSTGTIGSELITLLREKKVPLRALVRSATKADALRARGIDTAVGDFDEPASLDRALDGVTRLFLLSAAHERQVELQLNMIEAAKRAGIGYLVKVSVIGAGPDAPIKLGRDHGAIERALRDTGIPFAALRPHSFMQNMLGSAELLRTKGEFYGSTGDARIPLIDARDVAAAAAVLLIHPSPESGAHVLTGPEAISNDEVASILTAVMGKPIRYVDLPGEHLKAGLLAAGMPQWLANDLQTLEAMWAKGEGTGVSDAVPHITGRPARSFRDFARDHVAEFRGGA